MKHCIDVRLDEDWARKHLGDDVGEPLSAAPSSPPHVRKLELEIDDPFWDVIKPLFQEHKRRKGRFPYASATGSIYYDPKDLENAELLLLLIKSLPEIFGGQWGTEYDEANVCPKCGAGRQQVSPLRLNSNKLSKKSDFAETITAGEWLVSERLAELVRQHDVSGCQLQPIVDVSKKASNRKWFQLVITETAGEAVPPTRFGIDYFRDDEKRKYVCAEHGLLGLNILSEPYISRASRPHSDIAITTFRCGRYAGWLVPHPLLMISPRFAAILRENKVKGYELGVVHLV